MESELCVYLYAAGCWLTSSGVPFLFQDTLGGGIPEVSQLSAALIPVVTVKLNGPGPIDGPTDRRQNTFTHVDHSHGYQISFWTHL